MLDLPEPDGEGDLRSVAHRSRCTSRALGTVAGVRPLQAFGPTLMPRPKPNPHTIDPRRWYGFGEHRKRAQHQLNIEPTCRLCRQQGVVRAAVAADHIEPVIGPDGPSYTRFRLGELRSLCAEHHNRVRTDQARGLSGACDESGWPTDARHPWNVAAR